MYQITQPNTPVTKFINRETHETVASPLQKPVPIPFHFPYPFASFCLPTTQAPSPKLPPLPTLDPKHPPAT